MSTKEGSAPQSRSPWECSVLLQAGEGKDMPILLLAAKRAELAPENTSLCLLLCQLPPPKLLPSNAKPTRLMLYSLYPIQP